MKFTQILFDKKYKKAIKWLWITSFGGTAILAILVMFLWNDWVPKSYKLPPLEELENPTTLLASEVYSSDGILLGKYFLQNRSNASFEELSPQLINALIATEDVRFYDHSGIDFRRVFTGALFLGTRGGASTITQQLAKNLFPRKRFNNVFNKAITKFKEWITAIRIEQRYTKQEILTMYFNTVEFGGKCLWN
jgi:penicillin-binding protein 1A